jgi:hypothetical protein
MAWAMACLRSLAIGVLSWLGQSTRPRSVTTAAPPPGPRYPRDDLRMKQAFRENAGALSLPLDANVATMTSTGPRSGSCSTRWSMSSDRVLAAAHERHLGRQLLRNRQVALPELRSVEDPADGPGARPAWKGATAEY